MDINEQENGRKYLVIIDVTDVSNLNQLHSVLKNNLGFPDFYGMNWDAFWDAITGLVEMPKKLVFIGWSNVEKYIPSDSITIKNLLNKFKKEYPKWSCDVEYK